MEEKEMPAWLETLWNVNPRLAEAAEKDVVRWHKLETYHEQVIGNKQHYLLLDEEGYPASSTVKERWHVNRDILDGDG
mgnify:CR=1 FL=1